MYKFVVLLFGSVLFFSACNKEEVDSFVVCVGPEMKDYEASSPVVSRPIMVKAYDAVPLNNRNKNGGVVKISGFDEQYREGSVYTLRVSVKKFDYPKGVSVDPVVGIVHYQLHTILSRESVSTELWESHKDSIVASKRTLYAD